jgi:peroxiredoxin Q/BCP
VELQENLETFEALDAEVWGISPDADEKRMSSFRDGSGITFPLLVDADSAAIESYGILNEEQGEVPHPTVVVVDRDGAIRFFHLGEDYRERPPAATILDALRALPPQSEAPAAGP